MIIDHYFDKDIAFINLKGDLTFDTTPQVEETLTALIKLQNLRAIILNLREISFISSSGLRVIVHAFKQLKALQKALALHSVPSPIWEAFQLASLDRVLPKYANEQDAIKSLVV